MPSIIGSMVVFADLTVFVLLHFSWNLKFTKVNVQRSLIQELVSYKFEVDDNAAEVTQNICNAMCKSAVDNSSVTGWFMKCQSFCKKLNHLARHGFWSRALSYRRQIMRASGEPRNSESFVTSVVFREWRDNNCYIIAEGFFNIYIIIFRWLYLIFRFS